MGGGSSNAAATLFALRELVGLPRDVHELLEPALGLGADVPFFLTGGSALGLERGDRILPLSDLPETELLLVYPPVRVSTARVFGGLGRLTPRSTPSSIAAFIEGAFEGRLEDLAGTNDLQEVVLREYPAVEAVYNSLLAAGVRSIRITGSGGTLFAPASAVRDRQRLLEALPAGTEIAFTRSLSRDSYKRLRFVS
jgi:4-diphosphocytidyl-2-C-methyl-D-erythritol kinase